MRGDGGGAAGSTGKVGLVGALSTSGVALLGCRGAGAAAALPGDPWGLGLKVRLRRAGLGGAEGAADADVRVW